MPLISEFPIAGPQGKQGPIGPQGKQGPEGKRGPMGPAGPGTGDMLAMVYDPQGKAIDVYKYTDDAAAGRADLTLSNLTDPQTALYNLGASPRPTLLINGNFRVNQRKKTTYNSAGITVDGWCITADTVTVHVTQTGISFQNTNGAGDSYFFQKIPVSEIDLSKPYTASVLFQSGSPTKYVEFVCYHPGDIRYTVFAGNSVDADGISTVTFTPPASTTSMEFRACSGTYGITGEFTAICAKLEQGEGQTIAYQDANGKLHPFAPLDYGQELARCQRYLQVFDIYDAFVCIDSADAYTDFMVPLNVPFRTQPVVVKDGGLEGLFVAWYNGGNLCRMRIPNRAGTPGEVIGFSSVCQLSAEL